MSPIRFFCPRCNLMMKIGASMLGKSVVCPDCGNRTEVPFQSDSRAEALHQRMQQRKTDPMAPPSELSANYSLPEQQTPSNPQSPPGLPVSVSPPTIPLSPSEIEQIDTWIDRIWTDVPDSGIVRETRSYHAPFRTADTDKEPENGKSVDTVPRLDLRWAATVVAAVFLIGVVGGFVLRPLVVYNRHAVGGAGMTGNHVTVVGKLIFETPDGRVMPDADAVVIFLPINSKVFDPLSGRGLRPQDDAETAESDLSESVQQIEQLGGRYHRTDAEGKFSFSVDAEGRYIGILISSHAVYPTEAKWNAETERALRRFFREPAELWENYRFLCGEYELKRGEKLSIQHNFSQ